MEKNSDSKAKVVDTEKNQTIHLEDKKYELFIKNLTKKYPTLKNMPAKVFIEIACEMQSILAEKSEVSMENHSETIDESMKNHGKTIDESLKNQEKITNENLTTKQRVSILDLSEREQEFEYLRYIYNKYAAVKNNSFLKNITSRFYCVDDTDLQLKCIRTLKFKIKKAKKGRKLSKDNPKEKKSDKQYKKEYARQINWLSKNSVRKKYPKAFNGDYVISNQMKKELKPITNTYTIQKLIVLSENKRKTVILIYSTSGVLTFLVLIFCLNLFFTHTPEYGTQQAKMQSKIRPSESPPVFLSWQVQNPNKATKKETPALFYPVLNKSNLKLAPDVKAKKLAEYKELVKSKKRNLTESEILEILKN